MKKRIVVEIKADIFEAIQQFAKQRDTTVEHVIGEMIDHQALYQIAVEKMRPPQFDMQSPPFGAWY